MIKRLKVELSEIDIGPEMSEPLGIPSINECRQSFHREPPPNKQTEVIFKVFFYHSLEDFNYHRHH